VLRSARRAFEDLVVRLKRAGQGTTLCDHRGADSYRGVTPLRVWPVYEEDVPRCCAVVSAERPTDRATEDALAVPVAPRAVVYEEIGDLRVRVSWEHGDPSHEHAKSGLRVLFEDVLLCPTGTVAAGVSGRSKQQNKARVPAVMVEVAGELLDARDRLQLSRSARRSRTAAASGDYEHADEERGQDQAHATQSR
jgi:hypothetical protein